MSLTKEALYAIKEIAENSADDVKQQTAADFAEVHDKIDSLAVDLGGVKADLEEVKSAVGRIENTQRAEVARADEHGQVIAVLKQKLV